MANFLYQQFLRNYLLNTNAVDFDADTIKAALFRSSSYTPDQTTDEFLATAGTPIATATLATTVVNNVVHAADFVFLLVGAGAEIDLLVIYQDSGAAATSPLIVKYDIAVTPDGGDITVSVPAGGLFTLGNVATRGCGGNYRRAGE